MGDGVGGVFKIDKGAKMIRIFQAVLFSLLMLIPWVAMGLSLKAVEYGGITRSNEPIRFTIPFAKGELRDTTGIKISGHPAQFSPISYWPDSSYRFLLVRTQVSVTANDSTYLTYTTGTNTQPTDSAKASKAAGVVTVTTGPLKFTVREANHNLFNEVWLDTSGNRIYADGERIVLSNDTTGTMLTLGATDYFASANTAVATIEEAGPMEVVIKITGYHCNVENDSLRYVTRIHAYAGKSYVKIMHTLINGYSPSGSMNQSGDATYFHSVGKYRVNIKPELGASVSVKTGRTATDSVNSSWSVGDTFGAWQNQITLKSDSMSSTVNATTSDARIDGWCSFFGSSWGMGLSSRFFYEKFPKGLFIDSTGRVTFDIVPDQDSSVWLVGSMGAWDEFMVYFGEADSTRLLTYGFLKNPIVPRVSAEQFSYTQAFQKMVVDSAYHDSLDIVPLWLDSCVDATVAAPGRHLYFGWKDFGDIAEYAGSEGTRFPPFSYPWNEDATVWGGNFYDPLQTIARQTALRFKQASYNFMCASAMQIVETNMLNSDRLNYYWNGLMPAAGLSHRYDNNAEKSFLGGPFYVYCLTGNSRIKERMLEGAGSVISTIMANNTAGYARQTYQNAEILFETYKITNNHRYSDSCRSMLEEYFSLQNENGGVVYQGETYPEQVKMQCLVVDLTYKYLRDFRDSALAVHLLKNCEFFNAIGAANNSTVGCRKTADVEDYWNHGGSADIMYFPDNCDVAASYAYAEEVAGEYDISTLTWGPIADSAYFRLLRDHDNVVSAPLHKGEAKTARELQTGIGATCYDRMNFDGLCPRRVW